MTALIIILSLLILALGFILFARIKLEINTMTESYYLDMGKVIRISLHWKEEPLLHFRIFFFHFDVDVLKVLANRKKSRKHKTQKRKKGRTIHFRKIWALLKSFRIKRFQVGLDTQNVITNASLFPAAAAIHLFTPIHLNINYNGENYAVIHIENRVARMLWAYIKH